MSEATTLGALASQGRVLLNDGYRTRSDELGLPGVAILRVAEIQDGFIAPSFGDHVHENFRSKFASKCSAAGDVVVTTKGTVGRVALMRPHHPEFVYSPQVCFFRCEDGSGVCAEWLYYWFRGPEFRAQAAGVQSQTDMAPYINLADMRRLTITVPSPAVQRAIAGVLGALDDKIESNRRLISTCTQLAGSLLSAGGDYVRVGDRADIVKGLSYKGVGLTESTTATPMFNLGNFSPSGWLNRSATKYYTGGFKDRHTVRTGDLIVANTDLTQQRVILGRPALVPPLEGAGIITHHVFAVRSDDPRLRLGLWAQLNGSNFRERAEGYATGTTVASMPADALADFIVTVPSQTQVDEAQALIERAWRAESESDVLAATRDALLPELLSGRLQVRSSVELFEGAV